MQLLQKLQLVMQPATTLGVTMATYCGQNIGAKRYDRIKLGVKKCTNSIITSLISAMVLIFLGKYFVMMFVRIQMQKYYLCTASFKYFSNFSFH